MAKEAREKVQLKVERTLEKMLKESDTNSPTGREGGERSKAN